MYSIQNEIEWHENNQGKVCYRMRKTIAAKRLNISLGKYKELEKEYHDHLINVGSDHVLDDLNRRVFALADSVKECCEYLDLDFDEFDYSVSAWMECMSRKDQ